MLTIQIKHNEQLSAVTGILPFLTAQDPPNFCVPVSACCSHGWQSGEGSLGIRFSSLVLLFREKFGTFLVLDVVIFSPVSDL